MHKLLKTLFLLAAVFTCHTAVMAADFRSTAVSPAVMYDAPSVKSGALFIFGAGVPMERISSIQGWERVRDAQGSIGWMQGSDLSDTRMLQIRVPLAKIYEQASDSSSVVFEAQSDVLLVLDEQASSPATTLFPGWVRVYHKEDDQRGFIRISEVFGL
jgi:SH3-like domain-containing protein